MQSPTKLDFLFYDFSVIYDDFSDIIWKQIGKKKNSKPQYCSKTAIKNRPGVIWTVLDSSGGKLDCFIVRR